MENQVMFGTLRSDGSVVDIRKMPQSTFSNCPFFIMMPEHYREDGSCRCNDPEYRKKVMKGWGYTKRDFVRAEIIEKGGSL